MWDCTHYTRIVPIARDGTRCLRGRQYTRAGKDSSLPGIALVTFTKYSWTARDIRCRGGRKCRCAAEVEKRGIGSLLKQTTSLYTEIAFILINSMST